MLWRRACWRLFWLALVPTMLLAAWCYEPYVHSGPTLCLWRRWFDVECIGCGLTRAMCALAHGRVLEAVHYNPLVITIVPLAWFSCSMSRGK